MKNGDTIVNEYITRQHEKVDPFISDSISWRTQ